MLGQHPNVYWGTETFNDKKIGRLYSAYNTSNPWKALRLQSAMAKGRIFGFEIKGHPTQHPKNIGETLQDTIAGAYRFGCRHFILLTRDHVLRRFVSYLVGSKRNQWNYKQDERPEKVKVRVPIVSSDEQVGVLEFIERFDGIVERWRELIPDDCRTLELEYARNILGNPCDAYFRVAGWLELDEFTPTVDIRKGGTEPLDSVVTNWDEVREALNGTPHEWMLTDEATELAGTQR